MRMLTTTLVFVVAVLLSIAGTGAGQDIPGSRAMPGNEAPAGPFMLYWGPPSQEAPHRRPENQWRYRRYDGRWWYWTGDGEWSYFNGDIWVPYTADSDRLLSRAPLLGPIAGQTVGQGVFTRGKMAGLTMIPGDHAGAPHLKRGTVLPKYLKQEPLPPGEE